MLSSSGTHSSRAWLVDTAVGDARDVDIADRTVDAVLLLDPCITWCHAKIGFRRWVRRDGLPGPAPSWPLPRFRWAPRLDGFLVQRMYEDFTDLLELVDQVERHGVMLPLTEGAFTGYCHRPDHLREEITTSGMVAESVLNLEGIAFALDDLHKRLQSPAGREASSSMPRVESKTYPSWSVWGRICWPLPAPPRAQGSRLIVSMPDPVLTARALVIERFPAVRQTVAGGLGRA